MKPEKLKILRAKFLEEFPKGFEDENFIKKVRRKFEFEFERKGELQKLFNDLISTEPPSPKEFFARLLSFLENIKKKKKRDLFNVRDKGNALDVLINKLKDKDSVDEKFIENIFEQFRNFAKELDKDRFVKELDEILEKLKESLGESITLKLLSLFLSSYSSDRFIFYIHDPFKYVYCYLYETGTIGNYSKAYFDENDFAKKLKEELSELNPKDLKDIEGFVYYLNKALKLQGVCKKIKKGKSKISDSGDKKMEGKSKLDEILKWKKQIILEGPPGTGKTYTALELVAKRILKKDEIKFEELEKFRSKKESTEINRRWEIVQFHPSYSYEDFVQGIVAETNESGSINFKVKDKVFLKLANRALKDKENDYFLIIDEINRGDLSKIFGELILTLEYRNLKVKTPYSTSIKKDEATKEIIVPDNLIIIGTMNTADRSIALIDYALRRRFCFKFIEPNENLIKYKNAKKLFNKINGLIDDKNFKIGHSYFMNVENEDELKLIWDYEIFPILKEYEEQDIIYKKLSDDYKTYLIEKYEA